MLGFFFMRVWLRVRLLFHERMYYVSLVFHELFLYVRLLFHESLVAC
jgi:hypothetical protein